MGLLPLTYTRPKDVDKRSPSRSGSSFSDEKSDGSVKSGLSGHSAGIPESLGFDRIMNGGTCPPLTIRDFMNYLVYVEHSAENLQFYLWFKDYTQRFHQASSSELVLAPEWTSTMQDEAVAKIRRDNFDNLKSEHPAADIFKGSDFEKRAIDVHGSNPFDTPPLTAGNSSDAGSILTDQTLSPTLATTLTHPSQAAAAFESVGARQPFTIQPFREEINRVIATYIMDDAPRQLNLSSWEQKAAVQALSHTTHPSALQGLFKTVDSSLRRQAHPNFVRWSIYNGNPARVFFARALGIGLIAIGFAIAVVLTLSGLHRRYRAFAAIAWVLGISTLVAAYKGMCVVLHGMHHRHVRPWELFVQDTEQDTWDKKSFESFGSSNSYEDEPWIVKYEKRNVVRKVFDREVWIQEPALRQIQDTIFVQAILASLLGAAIFTGVFVAVPAGHFF